MAQHAQLRIDTDLDIYFCDPQAPWQRGTNENTNGLLRQYFPKGTDLSRHSRNDLDAVAAALNLDPPFGVCGCGDVGVLGLWSVAGGGFVRVREVLAGFGRFLGVFGRVWSAWGRAEPVGDVLLMVCLVGSVRGQQSCGRLRTPARAV